MDGICIIQMGTGMNRYMIVQETVLMARLCGDTGITGGITDIMEMLHYMRAGHQITIP